MSCIKNGIRARSLSYDAASALATNDCDFMNLDFVPLCCDILLHGIVKRLGAASEGFRGVEEVLITEEKVIG